MTDNEELENRNDALIEEYLLFLRGRGPEPDLSDLPPSRREEIREQFKIVKALADRGPELPPLEQDPVARRLGLVGPGASSSALILPGLRHRDAGAGDLLEASLDEVAFRFQGRIVIERAPAWSPDAPQGLRAVAQCAVLAEAVAVFAGDTDARAELPERLTRFFGLRPEVSAACVSSPDAEQAVVFSPADVTRSLNPALGWLDPHRPNSPEPLVLALGRFFEQRLPRWDRVAAADVFATMDALDEPRRPRCSTRRSPWRCAPGRGCSSRRTASACSPRSTGRTWCPWWSPCRPAIWPRTGSSRSSPR